MSKHNHSKHPALEATLKRLAQDAALPEDIDLWPSVRADLQASKSFSQVRETSMNRKWIENKRMRVTAVFAVTLLAAVVVLLATPQGQAWAQSAINFFTRGQDEIALPTREPAELALAAPGSAPATPPAAQEAWQPDFADVCGSFLSPVCSFEQVTGMVTFPLKAFTQLPEGMHYIGATGSRQEVTLVYRQHNPDVTVFLAQSPLDGSSDLSIPVAESAEIESVQVGDAEGEYVRGSYTNEAGAENAVWDPNAGVQTLRWQDGEALYTMRVMGLAEETTPALDRDTMLALAAGLSAQPGNAALQMEEPKLSVAQAAAQAGFDVVEPAWLPEGYRFDRAAYLADAQAVCLIYTHPDDPADAGPSLTILESTGSLTTLDDLFPRPEGHERVLNQANVTVGGAQSGQGVYASGSMDVRPYCGSLMQTSVLQFQLDDLNVAIFFKGGTLSATHNWLTQQQSVRLAESISGVQTALAGQPDPEYLTSIDEAASLAGFTLKQPTLLPQGMAFDHAVVEAVEGGQKVTLYYSDGANTITVAQTTGTSTTLADLSAQEPEVYVEVSVHNQPALISQGFWDANGWRALPDGGDGAASVTWIEGGVLYNVGGFNQYALDTWLQIAEGLQ